MIPDVLIVVGVCLALAGLLFAALFALRLCQIAARADRRMPRPDTHTEHPYAQH